MSKSPSLDATEPNATEPNVSEDIVRLALEACPCGMIMTDADGRIVLVNATAGQDFLNRLDLVDGYRRIVEIP